MKKIDFCIVGAQKGASSSIADLLSYSSEIWMPKLESNIFEDPFYNNKDYYDLLSVVSKYDDFQVGIKRPDYLCTKGVADRLYKHNSDMKIIISLRDPVERFISAAYWYMQVGLLPVISLNDLVILLLENDQDFIKKHPKATEVLQYGCYCRAIEEYKGVFGKNVFLFLDCDFRNEPEVLMSRLSIYLGIPPLSFKKVRHKKKAIYNKIRLKYMSWLNNRFFFKLNRCDDLVYHSNRNALNIFIFRFFKLVDTLFLSSIVPNEKEELNSYNLKALSDYYKDEILYIESVKQGNNL